MVTRLGSQADVCTEGPPCASQVIALSENIKDRIDNLVDCPLKGATVCSLAQASRCATGSVRLVLKAVEEMQESEDWALDVSASSSHHQLIGWRCSKCNTSPCQLSCPWRSTWKPHARTDHVTGPPCQQNAPCRLPPPSNLCSHAGQMQTNCMRISKRHSRQWKKVKRRLRRRYRSMTWRPSSDRTTLHKRSTSLDLAARVLRVSVPGEVELRYIGCGWKCTPGAD